jgi:hypothetical protein
MTTAVPVANRFLVEWYRPNLTRELIDGVVAGLNNAIASMSAEGARVWLVMTVAVPTDEVLYGVFAAESPDLVRAACERAGAVPERMSIDIDARTF